MGNMHYICSMYTNHSTPRWLFICCAMVLHMVSQAYAQDSTFISKHTPIDKESTSLVVNIDNYNFFDNREVHSLHQHSQTLFGARIGAEIGVQFEANQVIIGAMGIKNFGESGIAEQDITFYYHYEQGHFAGAFGAFPRWRLKQDLPDMFIYDSLRYYSPTINGALIQYTARHGYAELYCNWLNKQGVNQREIFEIVTDGKFGYHGIYAGWNAQLTHFSVPRPSNGLHVYDKLMLNPYIGIEKSNLQWLDVLKIEAGLMLSLNRDRKDMLWKSPMGFLGDFRIRKWRFELRDRLYAGNPQFSDYDTFGATLHRGDPYYRSSLYNRTDITFYLLNKRYIQCHITAAFHYTEKSLDNSQLIILHIAPDWLFHKIR